MAKEDVKIQAVAEFRCLANQKEVFAVLVPTAREGKFSCNLINADRASFRGGERIAINLSHFPVAFKFGGTQTQVSPNKAGKIGYPGGTDGDFVPMTAHFLNKKSEWKIFLSTRWVADANIRTLIFAYDNKRGSYPQFHSIDIRLLEKKETKRSR